MTAIIQLCNQIAILQLLRMGKYTSVSWTDNALLELLQLEHDYAAFTELYNRYWSALMSAASKRLGSVEVAEELVQDVFLSFYMRRKDLQVTTTVEAYLKGALRHQVFKVYRTQKLHDRYVTEVMTQNHTQPIAPDAELELKELRAQIIKVSEKMPEKCREVFVLSRFEHLSHNDIAAKLNISVNTVKKHINKAIAILRDELQDQQFDLLTVGLFLFFVN